LGNYTYTAGGWLTIDYTAYYMCFDQPYEEGDDHYDYSIMYKYDFYGCDGVIVCQTPIEGDQDDCCAPWNCDEYGVWTYFYDSYELCEPLTPLSNRFDKWGYPLPNQVGKWPTDAGYILRIPYLLQLTESDDTFFRRLKEGEDVDVFAVTNYYLYYDMDNRDEYVLIKTPEYHIDAELSENPFEEMKDKGNFYICHSELEDKNGDKWIFDSRYIDKKGQESYFEYRLKKNSEIIDIEIESDFKYWILTLYKLVGILQDKS